MLLGLPLLGFLLGASAAMPATPAAGAMGTTKQVEAGREIFRERCAKCHGDRGQGKIGPALIGPDHGLWGYATGQGLFDYVRKTMPFDAIGSLTEEQHWHVVAFILSENRFLPPGTTLGPSNAKEIRIQ